MLTADFTPPQHSHHQLFLAARPLRRLRGTIFDSLSHRGTRHDVELCWLVLCGGGAKYSRLAWSLSSIHRGGALSLVMDRGLLASRGPFFFSSGRVAL